MEKRFAKVVAGVVRNISVAARPEDATDCIPLVDGVDDEIGIGDHYGDGKFTKVAIEPSPEELKTVSERIASRQLQAETKAGATFKALEKADASQIGAWVDANFSSMTAPQRAWVKMVTTVAAMVLRKRS